MENIYFDADKKTTFNFAKYAEWCAEKKHYIDLMYAPLDGNIVTVKNVFEGSIVGKMRGLGRPTDLPVLSDWCDTHERWYSPLWTDESFDNSDKVRYVFSATHFVNDMVKYEYEDTNYIDCALFKELDGEPVEKGEFGLFMYYGNTSLSIRPTWCEVVRDDR